MAKLTKKDIEKLEALYEKGDNFEYDDLTPNLQAYADWFTDIEDEVSTMSHLKKFAWWGGNGYFMALEEVAKYDKPPRLGYNTKAKVDEHEFTSEIIDKIRNGEWN